MTALRQSIGMRRAAVLALAAVSTYVYSAFAGYRSPPAYVSIDPSARSAFGAAGSARNSIDSNQFIWCGLSASATAITAMCAAHNSDAATSNVICSSTNANIVAAVKAVGPDSDILFYWDANNQCTRVTAESGSLFEPKNP